MSVVIDKIDTKIEKSEFGTKVIMSIQFTNHLTGNARTFVLHRKPEEACVFFDKISDLFSSSGKAKEPSANRVYRAHANLLDQLEDEDIDVFGREELNAISMFLSVFFGSERELNRVKI